MSTRSLDVSAVVFAFAFGLVIQAPRARAQEQTYYTHGEMHRRARALAAAS